MEIARHRMAVIRQSYEVTVVCREANPITGTQLMSYGGHATSDVIVRRRTTMAQHREKAVPPYKHGTNYYSYNLGIEDF